MSKITNIKKDIVYSYSYIGFYFPERLCRLYCHGEECNSNKCIIHKALPKLYMEDIK